MRRTRVLCGGAGAGDHEAAHAEFAGDDGGEEAGEEAGVLGDLDLEGGDAAFGVGGVGGVVEEGGEAEEVGGGDAVDGGLGVVHGVFGADEDVGLVGGGGEEGGIGGGVPEEGELGLLQGVGEGEMRLVEGGFVQVEEAGDQEGVVVGKARGFAGTFTIDAAENACRLVIQMGSDAGDCALRRGKVVSGQIRESRGEGSASSRETANGQTVPGGHDLVIKRRSRSVRLSERAQLSSSTADDAPDIVLTHFELGGQL
nr:hypothetical protein CFP56_13142 [Quercus suber]